MTVEFALRPRIRLREQTTRGRRSDWPLARLVLPVAGYWLAVTGIVYGLIHSRVSPPLLPAFDESALAAGSVTATARTAPQRAPSQLVEVPAEHSPEASRESPQSAARARPAEDPPPSAPPASDSFERTSRVSAATIGRAHEPPRQEISTLSTSDESSPARPTLAVIASRGTSALPSCEAALATANQEVDFTAGNNTADLPSQTIARVLDGPWIEPCGVPQSTSVEVCVAIRGGSVVGVSVATVPADGTISTCIRRRAATLQFPYSPRLDIARTRF